ncbi:MAG: glycosyltransferase family 4 protein [Nitrospirota bacterium]
MNRNLAVAIIAPSPPPYGGMALQAEKLHEKLTKSGVASFFIKSNVPFPYFLKFLEKISGVRTFMRFIFFSLNLLQLRKATIVHLFGASHVYFFLVVGPSILMAKMMDKKIILNYRGGEAEKFFKKWGFIAIPLIKKADVIAVPSLFLKEFFEKITGEKVTILPNLIDIEILTFRERTNLKPFIVVSRQLEPRYNIACALRAFNIIKRTYPDAQLMIAGTGSEENRLKKLKEEMSLKDVYFLGAMSHSKLSEIYDKCDIMMNPSNADNFPGSILEAFACGIPVVTTRVGGIPFMVKEGENGFLVNPDDYDILAERVLKLLQNPKIAQTFSINGRKVAEKYSWENIKQIILDMYYSV